MKRTPIKPEMFAKNWFPASDDAAWKKWVDLRKREHRDLVELLSSSVGLRFKERALFLLLVPGPEFNPLYWHDELGKFYDRARFLETMPDELAAFAVRVIVGFWVALIPQHQPAPKHAVAGGGGVTLHIAIPDKYHRALDVYNDGIRQLIPRVPPDIAEGLFAIYSLNDISSYWNMDDASGYNPFLALLFDPKIADVWKKKADAKMRQIIQDERDGRSRPREDWENAMGCYVRAVNMFIADELPYDQALLIDQLRYLTGDAFAGLPVIESWRILPVLKRLSDPGDRDLLRRVIKAVVLSKEGFAVYSDDTRLAAEAMLLVIAEDEPDVSARIILALEAASRRQKEDETRSMSDARSEADVLAQMH